MQRTSKRAARPSAITFDLWATLLDHPRRGSRERHDFRVSALSAVLLKNSTPKKDVEISDLMNREWSHYGKIWREDSRTMLNNERARWMVAQLGCKALGQDLEAEVASAFNESLWEGPPTLWPGALQALEVLRRAGVPLGVISDTSFSTGKSMRRLLQRYGVLDFFDSLIFSDEIGRSKPHSSLFEQALTELGAAPSNAWHLGDNEWTDVKGALDAGMQAIRFHEDPLMKEAPKSATSHNIASFEGLLALFDLSAP